MKYPFVILYRKDIHANIDTFFIENANALNFSIFIANSIDYVKHLHNSNYHILLTYGDSEADVKNEILTVISESMLVRHIHMDYLPELKLSSTFFY